MWKWIYIQQKNNNTNIGISISKTTTAVTAHIKREKSLNFQIGITCICIHNIATVVVCTTAFLMGFTILSGRDLKSHWESTSEQFNIRTKHLTDSSVQCFYGLNLFRCLIQHLSTTLKTESFDLLCVWFRFFPYSLLLCITVSFSLISLRKVLRCSQHRDFSWINIKWSLLLFSSCLHFSKHWIIIQWFVYTFHPFKQIDE